MAKICAQVAEQNKEELYRELGPCDTCSHLAFIRGGSTDEYKCLEVKPRRDRSRRRSSVMKSNISFTINSLSNILEGKDRSEDNVLPTKFKSNGVIGCVLKTSFGNYVLFLLQLLRMCFGP